MVFWLFLSLPSNAIFYTYRGKMSKKSKAISKVSSKTVFKLTKKTNIIIIQHYFVVFEI